MNIVCFHNPDEDNGYLSNWYPSPFTVDGVAFSSMEQFMMYRKAICFGDEAVAAQILSTSDVAKIKSLGRQVSNYDESMWNGIRQIVVCEGLLAKFSQNDELKAKLKATGNAVLAECAVKDCIRLTNLVPELLEYVDEGRIKMRPAVELSFLDEDSQRDVVDEIDLNDATPSHDQTIRMRKFFEEGKLTTEAIQAIMSEEKPNQREKIVLRGDRVRQLIPKNIPISQTEDFVCKALEHYNKFLRSRADRDSR